MFLPLSCFGPYLGLGSRSRVFGLEERAVGEIGLTAALLASFLQVGYIAAHPRQLKWALLALFSQNSAGLLDCGRRGGAVGEDEEENHCGAAHGGGAYPRGLEAHNYLPSMRLYGPKEQRLGAIYSFYGGACPTLLG
jgi:hypothetical protein